MKNGLFGFMLRLFKYQTHIIGLRTKQFVVARRMYRTSMHVQADNSHICFSVEFFLMLFNNRNSNIFEVNLMKVEHASTAQFLCNRNHHANSATSRANKNYVDT